MLKAQYGFLPDPSKELWENMETYYGNVTPELIFIGRPANKACHDICKDAKTPVGIEHLLGLGAKYCEKRTTYIKEEDFE